MADLLPTLLLAVLLALGLAAMHTLGHLDGHDAPMPVAAGTIHAEGGHSASHQGGEAPSENHDIASVCLAILATLILLALPLLHLASLFDAQSRHRSRLRRLVAGSLRGPPAALLLTRTVVLRT
ncbi:hypothetical protein [Nonomuraea sp. NPDC049695]|uniref:hypothetical protein n=1 Tax=Nonomuraea sp. NPDC049695 TaxID=3154734 RepID=UPI003433F1EA